MMYTPTKKEQEEHVKELIKFCKENHCLMYNYMLTIKQIRAEPEEKLLHERLRKQADNYKRSGYQESEELKERAEKLKERAEKLKKEAKEFIDKTKEIVKEANKLFK